MNSYDEKYSSYEGHETWSNALRMQIKMHLRIVVFVLLLFIILSTLYTCMVAKEHGLAINSENLHFVISNGNKSHYLKLLIAVFALYPVALVGFRQRAKNQSNHRYLRGARLIAAEELNRQIKKRRQPTAIPLGAVKMPVELENRATIIIGKPGTGKSQCFRQIVKTIKRIGAQGIVYDHKGEYLTEFYDPQKDLIFNPLDTRSLGWNVFNELRTYMDVDAQAASLIPPSISATDQFWNDAARGVYSGCLHYLYQNELRTNAHLWKMLTAEAKEMSNRLAITRGGEAGYRYITQNVENSRQAESVLAVMMQYTRCFEYMASNDGDFSINNWLSDGSGLIFITNYEDVEETLRPILSLFIDLMGRKLLSMADNLNRRVYLLLDEFGSLQRMSSIVKMLTKGRSKGVSAFIGIQDDGQMEKTYGRQLLKTLDNAPGNRITFALSGETAERESKFNIGDTEYREIERSQSMGPNDHRDGMTLRNQRKREPLFLPADISNLPDLTGIVKLRDYHFALSKWAYDQPKPIHPPFLLRPDLVLENIVAEQRRLKEQVDQIKIEFNGLEN
jgi:type IV secretory pathway TraG/TraD family ATPase VirD4